MCPVTFVCALSRVHSCALSRGHTIAEDYLLGGGHRQCVYQLRVSATYRAMHLLGGRPVPGVPDAELPVVVEPERVRLRSGTDSVPGN